MINTWCIMATCGRHKLLERAVRYFLDQDYEGASTLLIYNNSSVSQKLDKIDIPTNKDIILINNHLDLSTGKPYTNLGAIYNDALTFVGTDCQLVCHTDDDDTFLPNHISEGVKGYIRAVAQDKIAYKPAKSYYRHSGGVELMSNTLEPSIFVQCQHLKMHGYRQSTTDQHLQWVDSLIYNNDILVDPNGEPTLIYDWNNDVPTWKTSGAKDNFGNYRSFSQDHGDKVITPALRKDIIKYYI